jgi:hypothetical protein
MGELMLLAVLLPSLLRKDLFTTAALAGLGRLRSFLARSLHRTSPGGLLATGALNGLLPCGMVYFALAGALVQDGALAGALFMALFALGTWPAMLAVRIGGGAVPGAWRSGFRRAAPVFFALLGALFILRGLGLGIPYVSPIVHEVPVGVQECH